MYTMRLMELVPPSVLPRGQYRRRPFRKGCGSVSNAQSYSDL